MAQYDEIRRMYTVQKVQLPSSELGDDRCFQINYYGHGDIMTSVWQGPLEIEPQAEDGISVRYGFAHGFDSMILASLAGYLWRAGQSPDDIRQTMQHAGEDVLADDQCSLKYHSYQSMVHRISRGEPLKSFDLSDMRLDCLALPVPAYPGTLDKTGGTGIYTTRADGGSTRLVLAKHTPVPDTHERPTTTITDTSEFCEQDVPSMARLVCKLALGEYRRDVKAFLTQLYVA